MRPRRQRNASKWSDAGPLPAKSQLAALLRSEVATDPEECRRIIVGAGMHQHAESLVDALKPFVLCDACGQQRYNPWAHRLFAQEAKILGVEQDVAVYLVKTLGVHDVSEAQSFVRIGKSAESATHDSVWRDGVRYFRARLGADPTLRARLREELFGEREVAANGNGVAHDAT